MVIIIIIIIIIMGLGCVVVIAICYGLDGPGIESLWGQSSLHMSRPALWLTQRTVQWVKGLFPEQSDRGVALITGPRPRLKKE
jgi:hypothetical protein